jgi:hypothetical protein
MDRLDHARHHTHFANPLAGEISYCPGNCETTHHSHTHSDAGPHHHHDADASDHHHSDIPAHQHGDSAIVFLAAQSFVLTPCMVPAARCESRPVAFVTFNPRGPDHPPKSLV